MNFLERRSKCQNILNCIFKHNMVCRFEKNKFLELQQILCRNCGTVSQKKLNFSKFEFLQFFQFFVTMQYVFSNILHIFGFSISTSIYICTKSQKIKGARSLHFLHLTSLNFFLVYAVLHLSFKAFCIYSAILDAIEFLTTNSV